MSPPRRRRRSPTTGSGADVAHALATAVGLHRAGNLGEAEALYRRILAGDPRNPDALHFLGVLMHQRARSQEAQRLIRAAIAAAPAYAEAHLNLGNVLKECGDLDGAEACYRRVLALRPGSADAENNLGAVLRASGRDADALAAFARALAVDADHADAHLNLGNALRRQGRIDEAIDHYLAAIALRRFPSHAYRNLGVSLYAAGRVAEAAGVYRRWLAYEPDNPIAQHMLAACAGADAPARASDAYVQEYFDRFAETFDTQLAKLDYRAPQLIYGAIAATLPPPQRRLDVLDAGCGTGLCASFLRPYARRLTGVDLASNMLDRARARGLYDELLTAELTAHLRSRPAAYDLIASADVLVYFGDLAEVIAAAAGALRPDGVVAFTLEACSNPAARDGFRLEPHGRFSHTPDYVRAQLTRAGLARSTIKGDTLRLEHQCPVAGLVVMAQAPGSRCRREV
jgi:predicted TPR repeat methyltransferase